jgi:alanyl-tRNA synthetase
MALSWGFVFSGKGGGGLSFFQGQFSMAEDMVAFLKSIPQTRQ